MLFIQQLTSHSPIFFQKEWFLGFIFLITLYFVQSRQYMEMYLYVLILFVFFFLLFLFLSAEFLALVFFIAYISLVSVLIIGYVSFIENWLQGFQPEQRLIYSNALRNTKGIFLSFLFLALGFYFLLGKDIYGWGGFVNFNVTWNLNGGQNWDFLVGEIQPTAHSPFFLFSYYFYATCKYLLLLVGLILYVSSLGSLALLKTQEIRNII